MRPSSAMRTSIASCSPCCSSLAKTNASAFVTKSRKARSFLKPKFGVRNSRCTTTPSSATRRMARKSLRPPLKSRCISGQTNMPTQSEPGTEDSKQTVEWKPSGSEPRRSVFGNFKSQIPNPQPLGQPPGRERRETDKSASALGVLETLQNRIDSAMGRVFVYQFLARAFDEPAIETWGWLTDSRTHDSLR